MLSVVISDEVFFMPPDLSSKSMLLSLSVLHTPVAIYSNYTVIK